MDHHHLFETEFGKHIFIAKGSQIYDLPDSLINSEQIEKIISDYSSKTSLQVPEKTKVRALSLSVAQSCNLACNYCYAQGGDFGKKARNMSWDIAKKAIDELFDGVAENEKVTISFMGGEPLLNRALIQDAVLYSDAKCKEKKNSISYAITTNATLITEKDAHFFSQFHFTVTISIDGDQYTHNKLRPMKGGKDSYAKIIENLKTFIKYKGKTHLSLRLTVTAENLHFSRSLVELIHLGADSVGVSPLVKSPNGTLELTKEHFNIFLSEMIKCAEIAEKSIIESKNFPFSNFITAIQNIHRGKESIYSCGAGIHYLSVSVDGKYYACHRFVEDDLGYMGKMANLEETKLRQNEWKEKRNVYAQADCENCWAKFLCGGGCHHEVLKKGRPGCDYIRGWLSHCLKAYIRISTKSPQFFNI